MSATERKLSDAQVAAIRADRRTLREIAREYRVSFSTIRNVKVSDYRKPYRRSA